MFEEIPMNCRYGYIRVSSKSQEENSSLEYQKKLLINEGVPEKNIRVEVGSAANAIADRTVFSHLIENELKLTFSNLVFLLSLKFNFSESKKTKFLKIVLGKFC